MNLHVIPDQKFIEDHISAIAKHGNLESNRFIFREKPPHRFLTRKNAYAYTALGSQELDRALAALTEQDKLFVHFLDMPTAHWLCSVKTKAPVHWIYYGSALYEYLADQKFIELYKPKTKRYINRYPYCVCYRNNIVYRALVALHRYSQKGSRKRNFETCIHNIDYFCYYNKREFDLIQKYLPSKMQFSHFFYQSFAGEYKSHPEHDSHGKKRVLIGNAASPLANHLNIFPRIAPSSDLEIHIPVS